MYGWHSRRCLCKKNIPKRAVNNNESQLEYVDGFITYLNITIGIEMRIAKKQFTNLLNYWCNLVLLLKCTYLFLLKYVFIFSPAIDIDNVVGDVSNVVTRIIKYIWSVVSNLI